MIILKKPIVTEKTVMLFKNNNQVTFEVNLNADKFAAIKALEEAFGVKVESVQVINRLGKKKRNRKNNRVEQKKANKKLMVFKLKDGDKISIFEQ
jgi:large subunit ribosomal protein L23